jgi:hypothetical protein
MDHFVLANKFVRPDVAVTSAFSRMRMETTKLNLWRLKIHDHGNWPLLVSFASVSFWAPVPGIQSTVLLKHVCVCVYIFFLFGEAYLVHNKKLSTAFWSFALQVKRFGLDDAGGIFMNWRFVSLSSLNTQVSSVITMKLRKRGFVWQVWVKSS